MTIDGNFANSVAAQSGGRYDGVHANINRHGTDVIRRYSSPAYKMPGEISLSWANGMGCRAATKGNTCCMRR